MLMLESKLLEELANQQVVLHSDNRSQIKRRHEANHDEAVGYGALFQSATGA
jgi:hypothetical protein